MDALLGGLLIASPENYVPPTAVPSVATQEGVFTASGPRATPMEDIQPSSKPQKTQKKRKRGENFLDGRTELTSDELKEIRETYLQRQDILRSEMGAKRREREAMLLFDHLLWAVPHDSEIFHPWLKVHQIPMPSPCL